MTARNRALPKQPTWLYRPKSGVFNARDVYVRMVFKMMLKDETLKRSFKHNTRFLYETIYRHQNGKVEVVADWMRFQVISEVYFWLMGEALIGGWKVRMGKLGYMKAFQFKPTSHTLTINWQETMRMRKEYNLTASSSNMVFYQPKEYCSVRLVKNTRAPGISYLNFAIAGFSRNDTALKDRFRKALVKEPLLKNRYPYRN